MKPLVHTITQYDTGTLLRGVAPGLTPPPGSGMREPGTNYLTYITATGPRTVNYG